MYLNGRKLFPPVEIQFDPRSLLQCILHSIHPISRDGNLQLCLPSVVGSHPSIRAFTQICHVRATWLLACFIASCSFISA